MALGTMFLDAQLLYGYMPLLSECGGATVACSCTSTVESRAPKNVVYMGSAWDVLIF